MTQDPTGAPIPALARVPTGVPGLDRVLGGGLLAGNAYLVAGPPGTGKTTLGNQLAFAHAAAGGTAVFATLLTETHDRMLAHLGGFGFPDLDLVGARVHYLSLLRALEEGGLDGALEGLRQAVRDHRATLLVVDGTSAAEGLAPSGFDYGRFVQGLQARAALLGCTTVLLSSGRTEAFGAVATSVDGVLQLANEPAGSRDVRWLRVAKLRGSASLGGRHQFAIGGAGVEVHPRLEAALAGAVPETADGADRAATGVAGLDAMLGGGLPRASSTMVLGTPGSGKTALGLHFVAEGARRGEPCLVAAFHETAEALAATAAGMGLDLRRGLESGLVRVLWQPPLEASPDAWAWRVLAAAAEQGTRRLVVDAFTDAGRLFADPQRRLPFLQALTNELRARRVTALVAVELDEYVAADLATPLPAVSATMDNGVLLRAVELRSRLHRVVSVLKMRASGFDPAIRSFTIGPGGMEIGEPFDQAAGLLTGRADPVPGNG